MNRYLAIFVVLFGLALVPLALLAPTSILLVPGHFIWTLIASLGAFIAGISGRGEQARQFGFGYLIGNLLLAAALEVGRNTHHQPYWMVPWLLLISWSWIPPIISGISGFIGDHLADRRTRRVIRRRQTQRLKA